MLQQNRRAMWWTCAPPHMQHTYAPACTVGVTGTPVSRWHWGGRRSDAAPGVTTSRRKSRCKACCQCFSARTEAPPRIPFVLHGVS